MGDTIEVVATLGDSIIDVSYGDYRIGTAPRVGLAVPGFESFALVSGMTFRGAPGVELMDGNCATALERDIAIPMRGLRARIGNVHLAVRRVTAPRRELPRGIRADRRALGYLLGSIAVHALLWGFAAAAPPGEADGAGIELGVASDALDLHVVAVASIQAQEREDSPDRARVGGGAPMAHPSSKAGSVTSQRAVGHIAIASARSAHDRTSLGAPGEKHEVAQQRSREEAIDAARTRGILGSTALRSDVFGTLVSELTVSGGVDLTNTYAPLYGGTGEAAGSFGLGYIGVCKDNCGDSCTGAGCGTIGTGRYLTISNGKHAGDGWGGGRGGADSIGRDARVPQIYLCGVRTCTSNGDLDKAIIRRYMRRNRDRFQYCYEKELLAHPDLAGVIELGFVIQANGSVTDTSATGGSDAVAACIAGVTKAIEFPSSHGPTEVHYPIEFRVAGG